MAVSVENVLRTLSAPLSEAQLWALAHGATEALLDMQRQRGSLPACALLTTRTVTISADGTVGINPALLGEDAEHCARFLPDEVKQGRAFVDAEKVHVFSLGALLFSCADYSLLEDEEPVLSEDLEALIGAMTDEDHSERCTLADVLQDCRNHTVEARAYMEMLKEVFRLTSSIGDAADLLVEPGDYRATTTTVASVVGASTQAYSRDNDLHAKLMDEIHLPHPLKDSRSRVLTGPAPYVTPHQRLMEAIKRSNPDQLKPVEAPTADPLFGLGVLNDDLQSEPSPVTETSSNTAGGGARRVKLPLKLELADADAVELLDKWDPTTHVQLAFAAEAAAEERRRIEAAEAERRRQEELAQQQLQDALREREQSDAVAEQNRLRQPATAATAATDATPASSGGQQQTQQQQQPQQQYMDFGDLSHIARNLYKAELNNLDDDTKLYDALVNRKLCGCCRRTRFNLLQRPRDCQMCGRGVCSGCCTRVALPPHMVGAPKAGGSSGNSASPQSAAEGKTVLLCTHCRSALGGAQLAAEQPSGPLSPTSSSAGTGGSAAGAGAAAAAAAPVVSARR